MLQIPCDVDFRIGRSSAFPRVKGRGLRAPDYAAGGFLAGHQFSRPKMDTTCAACDGGQIYGEYTGAERDYKADVHFSQEKMTCIDRRPAEQLHRDGEGKAPLFRSAERPACADCHRDAVSGDPERESHAIHRGKVACQVCHAQEYKNCFQCHGGTDDKGIPYFKIEGTKFLLKIGRDPRAAETGATSYALVRHPPVSPDLFDFYVEDAFADFSALPTWKRAAPQGFFISRRLML
jgi:hypothetical protein